GTDVLRVPGDFADVESMVALRKMLADRGGIDTAIVMSTLCPLMEVAGVAASKDNKTTVPDSSAEGIQRAVDVAALATRGKYVGPLVAVVTFIPLLTSTPFAPAILFVSSLASAIPVPTCALYASTNATSLLLYQARHPLPLYQFAALYNLYFAQEIQINLSSSRDRRTTFFEASPARFPESPRL
ncbi:hypothetical protein C8J57DRAFT_1095674, partial [Mycena rebaudengoi]